MVTGFISERRPASNRNRWPVCVGIRILAEGLDKQEIAAQLGVSVGQVSAVKAHIKMGTYGGEDITPEAEAEVASAVDTAFSLERDLQDALRRSIEQLEAGLTIIDGGREQIVPSGRIDITARDERGTTVVIELKAGAADRDAIGQILSYIGDVSEQTPQVRGILVAREFLPRAVAAASAAANIRLVQYGIRFTFEIVALRGQRVEDEP
jgi:hypothetical protein